MKARTQEIWANDVQVGMQITSLKKIPTPVQLFRFSAVTWNPHLIHINREYAQFEGYPDVLVQGHLHGSFLMQAIQDWAGPLARLLSFRWQNRHIAIPGDELTIEGIVVDVREDVVDIELQECNQDGVLCAPAWAAVRLPRRGNT